MNKMKKVLCGFLTLVMAAGGVMAPVNHAEAAEQNPAAIYSRTKNKIDLSSFGKITMNLTSDGVMWGDCWSAGGYANGTIGYYTNETNNKF